MRNILLIYATIPLVIALAFLLWWPLWVYAWHYWLG
jgi:hypothetical protein